MTPSHPDELPVQGYVVEFRRQSYRWTALVQTAAADEEGRAVSTQTWLPIERLIPVRSDPNDGGRVRSFG